MALNLYLLSSKSTSMKKIIVSVVRHIYSELYQGYLIIKYKPATSQGFSFRKSCTDQ